MRTMKTVVLLSTSEVAERAGVTAKAVHTWVRAGKLQPAARAGATSKSTYLFDPDEVARFLEERAA